MRSLLLATLLYDLGLLWDRHTTGIEHRKKQNEQGEGFQLANEGPASCRHTSLLLDWDRL